MNLRIRDHAVTGVHRLMNSFGSFKPQSLDEIRQKGFQRILIVATTAIGDALLCTPLIHSLRKNIPNAHLGFWVRPEAEPLFRHSKDLNALHLYHGKYRKIFSTIRQLREKKYDLALVANANDPDVIPMIWWSHCHHIIRRPQRFTCYHYLIANPKMLAQRHTTGHAIDRNLEFCDLLHLPRQGQETHLNVPEETIQTVLQRFQCYPQPWWVIHPGASQSRKQWGLEHYSHLILRLLSQVKGTILLTGSVSETSAGQLIKEKFEGNPQVADLTGQLSLDELSALLKQSRLMISGDTGPYHIAMAVNTPTVTLFAPWDEGSSPAINGPCFHQEKHAVVQTVQMGDSITTISVESVFSACQPFLDNQVA